MVDIQAVGQNAGELDADVLFFGKKFLHLRRVNGAFFFQFEQRREPMFLGRMFVLQRLQLGLHRTLGVASVGRGCEQHVLFGVQPDELCFLRGKTACEFVGLLLICRKCLFGTHAFTFEAIEPRG